MRVPSPAYSKIDLSVCKLSQLLSLKKALFKLYYIFYTCNFKSDFDVVKTKDLYEKIKTDELDLFAY